MDGAVPLRDALAALQPRTAEQREGLLASQARALDCAFDAGLLSAAHRLNLALYRAVGADRRILRNQLALFLRARVPDKARQVEEQLGQENLADRETRRLLLAARKPALFAGEYVDKLREFLRDFGDDLPGWVELAETYEAAQQFEKAIHCREEALLLAPEDPWAYQRLGELHFSLGRPEHLLLAAKHFAFVAGLAPRSYRALKALELTARLLEGSRAEGVEGVLAVARGLLAGLTP